MTGMNRGMVRSMTEGCLTQLAEEEETSISVRSPPTYKRTKSLSDPHLNWSEESDAQTNDDSKNRIEQSAEEKNTSLIINDSEDTLVAADAQTSPADILRECLDDHRWDDLKALIREHPQLVAKERVVLICQGEKVECSVLHRAVGTSDRPQVPLDVVQALVTAHPASLWKTDRHQRLPLHVALLKGASPGVIDFLRHGPPKVVRTPDDQGHTALHYAILYSTPDVALAICQAWPKALQLKNQRDRLPLHVLASVWSDLDDPRPMTAAAEGGARTTTWMDVLDDMLNRYPQAAWVADPWGRLPLHIVCEHVLVQANVLEKLIGINPAGLLVQDHAGKRPLDCLLHHKSQNVVVQYVRECTKKQQGGSGLFRSWRHNRKLSRRNAAAKKDESAAAALSSMELSSSAASALDSCYG